jgi:hypothetical protein
VEKLDPPTQLARLESGATMVVGKFGSFLIPLLDLHPQKSPRTDDHGSIIHNSRKTEQPKRPPTDENKGKVVHADSEKEWTSDMLQHG